MPDTYRTARVEQFAENVAMRLPLIDGKELTKLMVRYNIGIQPITAAGWVPDGDYLAAWRSGRLAPAGIPAPPPRQSRGMPW